MWGAYSKQPRSTFLETGSERVGNLPRPHSCGADACTGSHHAAVISAAEMRIGHEVTSPCAFGAGGLSCSWQPPPSELSLPASQLLGRLPATLPTPEAGRPAPGVVSSTPGTPDSWVKRPRPVRTGSVPLASPSHTANSPRGHHRCRSTPSLEPSWPSVLKTRGHPQPLAIYLRPHL